MKGTDRTILVALPIIALAVGFWLLVLSPKTKEASELGERIDVARAGIAAAQAQVAAGEEARRSFSDNYADLVSLGAAAPEDEDQATFINDLASISEADSVSFRSFEVAPGTGGTEAVAPEASLSVEPTATEPPEAAPVAAIPTEAAAAGLPIGATVGPAGLPVTPYDLTYFGEFFDMADLFESFDARVDVGADGEPADVNGRLVTIDGFALSADPVRGFPRVRADISVTTYLVPPEQGISAGATPAGPAPIGSPDAPVPVSTDPASTPAAVSP